MGLEFFGKKIVTKRAMELSMISPTLKLASVEALEMNSMA